MARLGGVPCISPSLRFYQQSKATREIDAGLTVHRRVTSQDVFFSHTWKSAGGLKAMALFLQGYWRTASRRLKKRLL